MLMNSLARKSLETEHIKLFQTLSYHYRNNIEDLRGKLSHRQESFASWTYYAKKAYLAGFDFAMETVAYDTGTLLIRLGREDVTDALWVYSEFVRPQWSEWLEINGKIKQVTQSVMVKTFWESQVLKQGDLARQIERDFLGDRLNHFKVFQELSSFNSPLAWELGDRFLSFTFLSKEILQKASGYFPEPDGLPEPATE